MNTLAQIRLLAASAVSLLLLLLTSAHSSAQQYHWVNSAGEHHITLKQGDNPLVRYMYAPLDESSADRRAETYKPYLHVYSPDGSQIITKGPGGLYPHHRGIYFGFNKITYGDGKKCDTWHCTNGAYEQHDEFTEIEGDETSGTLVSVVRWHGAGGELFAMENREQSVSRTDGMTQIDFESTLEPAGGIEKIQLDGDPQHAGVQFRASQEVADETAKQTYYVRSDGRGKPGETRNWNHNRKNDPINEETTNRPWLAMSFVLDDNRFTVLYLDHPDNPKPARYSERDYGRFGSYFVANVSANEPLQVKYRYLVKDGEMTVEECQALYDRWVDEP
jgi:hypothetical protein